MLLKASDVGCMYVKSTEKNMVICIVTHRKILCGAV
jgi:hypothetical protein